jgi:hypothetical protein
VLKEENDLVAVQELWGWGRWARYKLLLAGMGRRARTHELGERINWLKGGGFLK